MDMLRLDIRMVPFGPFPGDFLSLMVIVLPGSEICLTFFTVESTTGYHKNLLLCPHHPGKLRLAIIRVWVSFLLQWCDNPMSAWWNYQKKIPPQGYIECQINIPIVRKE